MTGNFSQTKQCPYCAETIKSAAVICRFCGTNLKSPRLPESSAQMLDNAVSWYIEKNWTLDTRTASSLHFRKSKEWSKTLVIGGILAVTIGLCVWPLLAVLGVIFLVLAVVDYIIKSDKKLNVTLSQLESGSAPSGDDLTSWIIAGLAIIAFILVIIASMM